MAVQYIVEDGSNKTNATSYITLEDFRQYWENRGVDYSGDDDSDLQVALNIATEYIDNLHIWEGYKQSKSQALQFPRDYCIDRNNIDQSGVVPQSIKNALCIAAKYKLDGNELVGVSGNIRSRSMGPVSVTFGSGGEKPIKLDAVERLVGDLVKMVSVAP